MEYRKLGKTGLDVSILSFGASSLGSVFRPIDENEGIRAVHVALDMGVNLIDCSPFCGITAAETVLGKALRGVPRDKVVLATKVGRYGDDEFDFSAQRVKPQRRRKFGKNGRRPYRHHPVPRYRIRFAGSDCRRDNPGAAAGTGNRARWASWASPVFRWRFTPPSWISLRSIPSCPTLIIP